MTMRVATVFAVQLTISNVAAIVTIATFAAGLAGIWFGARQMRTQAVAQKLTSVIETNNLWKEVQDVVGSLTEISSGTLLLVRAIFDEVIVDRVSALPRQVNGLPSISKGPPFSVTPLFQARALEARAAPKSHVEYEREMLDRAFTFALLFSTLTAIGEGRLLKIKDEESISAEQVNCVKADLQNLEKSMERYVGQMNNLAELYEQGLTPRRLFLGKRHIAILQQSFAAEPYILWRNSVKDDRWGMRVLALGQAARSYHWQSLIHTKDISLRGDPVGYGQNETYTGLNQSIGTIIAQGSTDKGFFKAAVNQIDERHLLNGFRRKDKKRQNNLREDLAAALPREIEPSEGWVQLAMDEKIQVLARQRLSNWSGRHRGVCNDPS